MKELNSFNELEAKLHMTLDRLSNNEPVNIKEEDIEQAGEEFKKAIRKHLEADKFRIRMSNVGRPLCQLQSDLYGHTKQRNPYNHFTRMLIGDAVESIVRLVTKASGVNITGHGNHAILNVYGQAIHGDDDIEIDHAIYDIKSASPYAFESKFSKGFDNLYENDDFGYVAQLHGYAKGQAKKGGGWIAVNKSTGELVVVPFTPTPNQVKEIDATINKNVQSLVDKTPFKVPFVPEPEYFHKRTTGNMKVPDLCTRCPFMAAHWPDAVLKPQALSKAAEPKMVWYAFYREQPVNRASAKKRGRPRKIKPELKEENNV